MSGSGGGGSAGHVSYPAYLEQVHQAWLGDGQVVTTNMDEVLEAALGNSPYTGETAYDPTSILAESGTQVTAFKTLVGLLSFETGLDDLAKKIMSDTRVQDSVDAFKADLDAQLLADVYPRFETGMRDINAVVSSAFVIGRSNIEEGRNREVSKYASGLRFKTFGDDALQLLNLRLEYERIVTQTMAETNRIKIVAMKEKTDRQLEIDEADAKWDLNVFQHAGNLIASVHGGVAIPGGEQQQKTSVLGGALSGAAAGAMMGSYFSGYGTVIGAVIGAVVGGIGAAVS